MIENEFPILDLPEQQQAQHILTIYISKASAILAQFLTEQDFEQEKNFGNLAEVLLRIKQEIVWEIERRQSLDKLCAHIGSKESTQKNLPLSIILKALSTEIKPQKIATLKNVSLIAPAVLPNLFIVQTRFANGGPIHVRQNYHLVGSKNLPKEYQYPIREKSPIPNLPEQQQTRQELVIYVSKALGILTKFLVEQDEKQEKNFGNLAETLFSIKQEMVKEIKYKHSLDQLCAHVGSNHNIQKNFLTETILKALSTEGKTKKIVTSKHTTLITPSVIPDLFIMQMQHMNGEADCVRKNYYLIGPKNLPEDIDMR